MITQKLTDLPEFQGLIGCMLQLLELKAESLNNRNTRTYNTALFYLGLCEGALEQIHNAPDDVDVREFQAIAGAVYITTNAYLKARSNVK